MSKRPLRVVRAALKSRWGLGALCVLLGVVVTGVAQASIPDSGGVIHGCYYDNQLGEGGRVYGDLRVIDTDEEQSCSGNETPLDWNQTGPPGPPGPQGPQGPQGPGGTNGQDGAVSAFQAEHPDRESLGHESMQLVSLSLSGGMYVVTGRTDVALHSVEDADGLHTPRVRCLLGPSIDSTVVVLRTGQVGTLRTPVTLVGTVSLPSGAQHVVLRCSNSGSPLGLARVRNSSIVAIPVQAIVKP